MLLFLSLSCLPRGAPGRNANIENSLKQNVFTMNLLGWPFCAKCKENKFQSTGTRKTTRKPRAKTAPATCQKITPKTLILAPKMAPKSLQNPSRKPVGGRWRPKTHPRRSQEQHNATKKAKERAKSAPRAPGSDFQGDGFPGRRLRPARAGPPGGVGEGLQPLEEGCIEWSSAVGP